MFNDGAGGVGPEGGGVEGPAVGIGDGAGIDGATACGLITGGTGGVTGFVGGFMVIDGVCGGATEGRGVGEAGALAEGVAGGVGEIGADKVGVIEGFEPLKGEGVDTGGVLVIGFIAAGAGGTGIAAGGTGTGAGLTGVGGAGGGGGEIGAGGLLSTGLGDSGFLGGGGVSLGNKSDPPRIKRDNVSILIMAATGLPSWVTTKRSLSSSLAAT